jgi:hypothetical protein
MRKIIQIFVIVFISLGILSGCGMLSPYKPPKDKEAYALLKLKFKYSSVLPNTNLGARMNIRHGAKTKDDSFYSAYNKTFGIVEKKRKTRPKIPMAAIKIHPGKKTDINMAVYFYWYTTQTYTTFVNNVPMVQTQQVYNEKACTTRLSFKPRAGKIYLLDYTNPNVSRDCKATAYKQTKRRNGKFKLKRIAKSKKIKS